MIMGFEFNQAEALLKGTCHSRTMEGNISDLGSSARCAAVGSDNVAERIAPCPGTPSQFIYLQTFSNDRSRAAKLTRRSAIAAGLRDALLVDILLTAAQLHELQCGPMPNVMAPSSKVP